MDGQDAVPQGAAVEQASSRRLPLLAIPLLLIALLLALYVGTNVLGVLFGVIAPPLPPLPADMQQVEHTSEAYGVDYWKYTAPTDACEVVVHLEANGGVCQLAPLQCGEFRETDGSFTTSDRFVARCGGQVDFSIFNMQWWALVMRTPDDLTQLEFGREVYWLGTGPQ